MSPVYLLLVSVCSIVGILLIYQNRKNIIEKAKLSILKDNVKKKSNYVINDKKIDKNSLNKEVQAEFKDIKNGLKRAELLLSSSENEEAKKILIHLLSIDEKNVDAHILLASIYLIEKKYSKSEMLYRILLDLQKKESASVFSNLAFCIFEQNKIDESIEFYRKALALEPKNVKRYSNLAQVLFVIKRFKETAFLFKKALRIDPRNTELLFMLADTYREDKLLKEAKKVYSKILEYEPYNNVAKEEIIHINEVLFN